MRVEDAKVGMSVKFEGLDKVFCGKLEGKTGVIAMDLNYDPQGSCFLREGLYPTGSCFIHLDGERPDLFYLVNIADLENYALPLL
jgi:hypothetical protein